VRIARSALDRVSVALPGTGLAWLADEGDGLLSPRSEEGRRDDPGHPLVHDGGGLESFAAGRRIRLEVGTGRCSLEIAPPLVTNRRTP